ncbi:MAG: dethiobiotin synthase [Pseudomonadota bacterium]
MHDGYIITGTDTGIGKTVFAAGLTAALNATYWKPIQSGLEDETDTQTVQRLGKLKPAQIHAEAYQLTTPCSPHRAAEIDGVTIDTDTLTPPSTQGPLIIEGAGGLLVPITNTTLQIDTFVRFNRPIILCARTALGTINHTLLSIEALRHRELPLAGVAFIGDPNDDSEQTICRMGRTTHLGRLPSLDPLDADTLRRAFQANFQTLLAPRTVPCG